MSQFLLSCFLALQRLLLSTTLAESGLQWRGCGPDLDNVTLTEHESTTSIADCKRRYFNSGLGNTTEQLTSFAQCIVGYAPLHGVLALSTVDDLNYSLALDDEEPRIAVQTSKGIPGSNVTAVIFAVPGPSYFYLATPGEQLFSACLHYLWWSLSPWKQPVAGRLTCLGPCESLLAEACECIVAHESARAVQGIRRTQWCPALSLQHQAPLQVTLQDNEQSCHEAACCCILAHEALCCNAGDFKFGAAPAPVLQEAGISPAVHVGQCCHAFLVQILCGHAQERLLWRTFDLNFGMQLA